MAAEDFSKVETLPLDDLVTLQGQASTTFTAPPLDGSLTLAQIVDWHAEKSPNHVWAVFPKQDGNGDLEKITWLQFARAVHRVAKLVKENVDPPENGSKAVVAVLVARDQLTYAALMAGILRAGYTSFPISSRNSPEGVVHLLKVSNSVAVFGSSESNEHVLVEHALDTLGSKKLKLIKAPTYPDIFLPVSACPDFEFLPPLPNPTTNREPSIIIHSSGSTAFPKPIHLSHLRILQPMRNSYYGSWDMCGLRYGIQSSPPFHGMGFLYSLAIPAGSGVEICVFTPREPPTMPNPSRVIQAFKETQIDIATGPPTNLIEWVKDDDAVAFLKTLKQVRFGGGPCPKDVGDSLVEKGVNLISGYGTTESGVVSNSSPSEPYGKDWEYMECTRNVKPLFEPRDEEGRLFEICFRASRAHIPSIFTDVENQIYRTNDLVEMHPTKAGFFKLVGRADDQIILSNGEKTNPGPLESIIQGHPLVKSCLYFGHGRFQNGILIEPIEDHAVDPIDDVALSQFRNDIWPSVERANELAPNHSRVFKEMVITTSPGKPFVYTPKRSVARPRTLELYKTEIEDLYNRVEESGSYASSSLPEPLTLESASQFMSVLVSNVVRPQGGVVKLDHDLFEQGCDSLQSIYIRNTVIATLRRARKPLMPISTNWVYTNPTVKLLAQSLVDAVRSPRAEPSVNGTNVTSNTLEGYAEQFMHDFPSHKGKNPLPKMETILVTGTTGTLGSYLLEILASQPNVSLVYAVNRSSTKKSLLDRQCEALEDRGIPPSLLSSGRVKLVEADLSKKGFGIPTELYKEMQNSVTSIIHNAWRLDFNLLIESFKPNIQCVRHLVDFALGSPFSAPPSYTFVSTVGTVKKHPPGLVPEVRSDPTWSSPIGYSQSKFVSERILEAASKLTALTARSVRVGQLAGSIVNGAWNVTDWFPMLVKSSETVHCLPEIDARITWIPVDVAAKCVVEFSRAKTEIRFFHLVNPHPVTWNTMIRYIATDIGVEVVPYQEWIGRLEAFEGSGQICNNPAIKLLSYYRSWAPPSTKGATQEACEEVRLATQLSEEVSPSLARMPQLTNEDYARCLAYWRAARYLV